MNKESEMTPEDELRNYKQILWIVLNELGSCKITEQMVADFDPKISILTKHHSLGGVTFEAERTS